MDENGIVVEKLLSFEKVKNFRRLRQYWFTVEHSLPFQTSSRIESVKVSFLSDQTGWFFTNCKSIKSSQQGEQACCPWIQKSLEENFRLDHVSRRSCLWPLKNLWCAVWNPWSRGAKKQLRARKEPLKRHVLYRAVGVEASLQPHRLVVQGDNFRLPS